MASTTSPKQAHSLFLDLQKWKFILSLPRLQTSCLFEDDETTCSLCEEPYGHSEEFSVAGPEVPVLLPCSCTFGHYCIKQWLNPFEEDNSFCPKCGVEFSAMIDELQKAEEPPMQASTDCLDSPDTEERSEMELSDEPGISEEPAQASTDFALLDTEERSDMGLASDIYDLSQEIYAGNVTRLTGVSKTDIERWLSEAVSVRIGESDAEAEPRSLGKGGPRSVDGEKKKASNEHKAQGWGVAKAALKMVDLLAQGARHVPSI